MNDPDNPYDHDSIADAAAQWCMRLQEPDCTEALMGSMTVTHHDVRRAVKFKGSSRGRRHRRVRCWEIILSMWSIVNIANVAILLSFRNRDHGALNLIKAPLMSINMSILLMLIVSFCIALAGVGQF
ncbi:hypothetical protein [Pseudomonas sp. LP_7_YM]|uniref:hypothetical protein n=1 Tax=Pseudomonas sp. LP_7_YM TaxID=2485137 RepID=UPI00105D7420|nr:hypothetical protein [Pseudomonas sp. LP_7_YM]TDV67799.1 hypothetical protein EC915_103336 [Pseudomonas sp. LP_7_YM]